MTLTLAEANSIVAAAIAKARELNIIICVAVCDKEGRLIALNRMDGALAEVDRSAIGKAVVSAGTGLPSGEVVGRVNHPLVGEVVGEGMPALHLRGGLPIFRNGQIEGACGADGALSHAQEEECLCWNREPSRMMPACFFSRMPQSAMHHIDATLRRIAGYDRRIDGADRDPGNPIGMQIGLGQRRCASPA